jgi:hypothetical protein
MFLVIFFCQCGGLLRISAISLGITNHSSLVLSMLMTLTKDSSIFVLIGSPGLGITPAWKYWRLRANQSFARFSWQNEVSGVSVVD